MLVEIDDKGRVIKGLDVCCDIIYMLINLDISWHEPQRVASVDIHINLQLLYPLHDGDTQPARRNTTLPFVTPTKKPPRAQKTT